ncbi:ribbon-helix-helix protein, CopG family [Microbacterium alcoholitolerans]|uniref:ribbon-helix-helix protein, CopG family n=1 Tax=unclassified Microbacterium TaxID=2609290 RepID=UPI003D17223A
MAMNLRLRPEAAAALKAESERTGLSQQEILRRAVDEHLGLGEKPRDVLPNWVEPPTRRYRAVTPALRLPEGLTSEQILDELRADRI